MALLRAPRSGSFLRQQRPRSAAALAVLELVPERGEPLNADNPDGGVYQLPFGSGCGLITYLLLADQDRVDVLLVTWLDFEEHPD